MIKQGSKEWFDKRRGRVTGSNVGAILGLNPWRTQDDVLRQMVRDYHRAEPEFTGNAATEWGSFHESGAIFEYTMETGNVVTECGLYVHPDHEWLAASPDGIVEQVGAILECKCPYGQRAKNPPEFKTANGQPHYWAQMQMEMVCAGYDQAHFWQWSPHGNLLEVIRIDHSWLARVIPELKLFHDRYLYELDNPEHLEEKRMKLTGFKYEKLLEKYDSLGAQAKDAQEKQKDIIAQLELATGGNDGLVCGRKFTRMVRAGSVAYAKVVKDHLPKLDLDQYRGKESSYWKLS